MAGSNAIACVVVIVASFCSNLGTNVQKQTHNTNLSKPKEERKKYYQMKMWWIGFCLTVLGAIGDFFALGFGQPSLVTAVGGSATLTGNLFVANVWNKEKIGRMDLGGVLCIIFSSIIIAVNTPPPMDLTLEELYQKYSSSYTWTYLIFLIIALAISMLFVSSSYINQRVQEFVFNLSGKMLKQVYDEHRELSARINEIDARLRSLEKVLPRRRKSLTEATTSFRKIVDISNEMEVQRVNRLLKEHQKNAADPYIYAGCSGVIGALSVLLGGVSSKLLLNAFQGEWSDFESPVPYLFMVGMIFTMAAQIDLLNRSLELGDAMSVYPVFMAFWIGFGTIGGIVLYELKSWGTMKTISYIIATVFMVAGIVLLTKHENREINPEKDELENDMRTTDLTHLLLLRDLENDRLKSNRSVGVRTPLLHERYDLDDARSVDQYELTDP